MIDNTSFKLRLLHLSDLHECSLLESESLFNHRGGRYSTATGFHKTSPP